MAVELKWVPTWEASDHRKKGWSEVLLHDGGCEEGHFLMASPVEEKAAQPEPAAPVGNEDCQKAKAEGPWLAEVLKPTAPVEMPEAVKWAIYQLQTNVRLWEIHGEQPAAETDRKAADALEAFWRTHAQPRPKLEKTRRALKCGQERLNIVFLSEETTTRWNNLFYEALAELDAAERGE